MISHYDEGGIYIEVDGTAATVRTTTKGDGPIKCRVLERAVVALVAYAVENGDFTAPQFLAWIAKRVVRDDPRSFLPEELARRRDAALRELPSDFYRRIDFESFVGGAAGEDARLRHLDNLAGDIKGVGRAYILTGAEALSELRQQLMNDRQLIAESLLGTAHEERAMEFRRDWRPVGWRRYFGVALMDIARYGAGLADDAK